MLSISLEGQVAFVTGIASPRSIASGIAYQLWLAGADLVLSYQGERLGEVVDEVIANLMQQNKTHPNQRVIKAVMDVTKLDEVDNLFQLVRREFGRCDIVVHCIAYIQTDALKGRVLDIHPETFTNAVGVSATSLLTLAQKAEPLMKESGGGLIVALTYLGGEQVIQPYGGMGPVKSTLDNLGRYLVQELGPSNIRLVLISSGPVSTPASRALPNFRQLKRFTDESSPLSIPATPEQVGNVIAFYASDLAPSVTGQYLYVDAGFHVGERIVAESSVEGGASVTD